MDTKLNIPKDPDEAHKFLYDKICSLREEIELVAETNKKQDERLEKIEKNTETLVEIFKSCEGAFKVFRSVGKALIWLGSLSSAIYAFYYTIVNWPKR